jgi:hypothetical protein
MRNSSRRVGEGTGEGLSIAPFYHMKRGGNIGKNGA